MRLASQLGGESEAGSLSPVVRDHREEAPSRASSICKELAEFGRQSFPQHSACSSSSFAQRGRQGRAFYSRGPSEVTARRLYLGRVPCPTRLSNFGRAEPQACPPSGEKEEEEVQASEGY